MATSGVSTAGVAGVPSARVAGVPVSSWKAAGLVVVLAVACLLPFTMSGFRLFQFTQVFIYAIALMGLNILTGYNGQISLGHGAFYAIGAYVAAILMALAFQYLGGYQPCLLCLWERYAYYFAVPASLAALLLARGNATGLARLLLLLAGVRGSGAHGSRPEVQRLAVERLAHALAAQPDRDRRDECGNERRAPSRHLLLARQHPAPLGHELRGRAEPD